MKDKNFQRSDLLTAITLLESDEPTNYEGKFIRVRDLALLRAAKELAK